MTARVIEHGRFEVRETRDGHRVLVLGDDRAFLWLRRPARALLILRGPGSASTRTLTGGDFVLVAFEGGSPGREVHLFLQLGGGYSEFVLPRGLPTSTSPAVRIVATDEAFTRGEIRTLLTTPVRARPAEERRRARSPPASGSWTDVPTGDAG